MSTEAPGKLMTVDEWLLFDVPEGLHAELVDGELVMTPLADPWHQIVLQFLIRQIARYMDLHPGVLVFWSSPGRYPIPHPEKARGREPDLALYDKAPPRDAGPLAWKQMPPLIVAEVISPGQETRDYVQKRSEYHRAEIPEYWILDRERQLFSALRRTGHGWDEHLVEGSGTYQTPLLPGFTLDVGQLWSWPE